MKTFFVAAVAAALAVALPIAAEAKPHSHDGANSYRWSSGRSLSGRSYGKRTYSGRSYSTRGYRSGYKSASRRPYVGRNAKLRNRSMTSRSYAGGGGGTSTTCLSSEARNLLGRIRSQFGNIQIISTCRPGARIAGSGRPSKHASGQAIDFRAPGSKSEVVKWLIANHRSGGTMTYSNMDHIHVDVGARFVALGSHSGR